MPEPVAPACHLEQARAPGASQLRFRGERPGRADDAGCVDVARVERPICAPPLCLPCAHTAPGVRSRPTWGPERQEGGRGGGGVREDLLLRPRPACAEFLALAGAPLRPPTETEAAVRPVLPCGGTAATSTDGAVNAPRLPGDGGTQLASPAPTASAERGSARGLMSSVLRKQNLSCVERVTGMGG